MSFEIKTPILKEMVSHAKDVITGIKAGTLEPTDARNILCAAGRVESCVKTDVKVRLAEPKLRAAETKLQQQAA